MKVQTQEKRELMSAVAKYLEFLKSDYAKWSSLTDGKPEILTQMYADFCNALVAKPGKAYIKIVARNSSHSFVIMQDNPALKLKRGDILRAASWAAPATNFAHGNVLIDKYNSITWAGV